MGLEGWININPRHAFNAPHAHAGYGWSGCYYVQQPTVQEGRSGEIEFLDPRSGVDGWPMTNGELTMTKFRIRPDAGSLLIVISAPLGLPQRAGRGAHLDRLQLPVPVSSERSFLDCGR
jgi:hypothetical protein